MSEFEIFFDDLKPKAQKELLKCWKIQDPKEMNWDSFPVACLEGVRLKKSRNRNSKTLLE